MRAAAILVVVCACGGSSQTVLSAIAETTLVAPQDMRMRYHEERDRHCRELLPPASHTFDEWQECMAPSYRLDRAVGALDAALRGAQATLDMGGRIDVGGLLAVVRHAAEAFREAGLPVPDEIDRLLRLEAGR